MVYSNNLISELWLGWIRVDPFGLIFHFVFSFGLFMSQVLCPPIFVSVPFYLYYLLLA